MWECSLINFITLRLLLSLAGNSVVALVWDAPVQGVVRVQDMSYRSSLTPSGVFCCPVNSSDQLFSVCSSQNDSSVIVVQTFLFLMFFFFMAFMAYPCIIRFCVFCFYSFLKTTEFVKVAFYETGWLEMGQDVQRYDWGLKMNQNGFENPSGSAYFKCHAPCCVAPPISAQRINLWPMEQGQRQWLATNKNNPRLPWD